MFAVFDRYGDIEPLGMGEQGSADSFAAEKTKTCFTG